MIGIRKLNKGFTLVELLVVMVIIGVLSGMLYLVFGDSDVNAKAATCYGNRETIMMAYENNRFTEGLRKEDTNYLTLDKFIKAEYKGTISNNKAKCPLGGHYEARSDDLGNDYVWCSVCTNIPDLPGEGTSGDIVISGDVVPPVVTPPNIIQIIFRWIWRFLRWLFRW